MEKRETDTQTAGSLKVTANSDRMTTSTRAISINLKSMSTHITTTNKILKFKDLMDRACTIKEKMEIAGSWLTKGINLLWSREVVIRLAPHTPK
jgi:hypothetical protein